jgi:preprotein translocase subunit YajC
LTTPVIFFVGLLLLFWLLIVVPQRRRRQQQASLVDELQEGDDVLTLGGLLGTVREVGEHEVVLEIAPDTRVRVAKSAVTGRIEPEAEPTETPETQLP